MRTVVLIRAIAACVVAVVPVFSTSASYGKKWFDKIIKLIKKKKKKKEKNEKNNLYHPFIYYLNVWNL